MGTVSLSHPGTPKNKTAQEDRVQAAWSCCGFLCLGACNLNVVLHCRCKTNCKATNIQYRLASDQNGKSVCTNRVYNEGDWCKRTVNLNFDKKTTISHKNGGKFYVNSGTFEPNVGTVRITC